MRWIKFFIGFLIVLFGLYIVFMYYFVEERKTFTIQKEIGYPIDKVYPQFENFQNFTRWNTYFTDAKEMKVNYYTPYSGEGSSISFEGKNRRKAGEMYIKYANPNRTLKYQLYESRNTFPTLIDIKFVAKSPNSTLTIWKVQTPKQPFLKKINNLWAEGNFIENLDKSFTKLTTILGNKIEKEAFITNIKYDSLMVEKQEGQLIVGVNVTTANRKKNALFGNILINYNKVTNFVATDLGKKPDEYGFPVLLTNATSYKDKEVSYYLGIPISKREAVSDNNFSYRTLNESEAYVMYYKGNYDNRVRAIQQLLQKAKRDTMRNGELQQVFLEKPQEGQEVLMKLSLPVYR